MSTTIPPCNNTSVGIVVRRGQNLLLLERQKFPSGFACPAGHCEDGEAPVEAAWRELQEETGLIARSMTLLLEGKRDNQCRRPGGDWHYWMIYWADVDAGQPLRRAEDEAKQLRFYSPEEVARLARRTECYLTYELSEEEWQAQPGLEVVWYGFLRQLGLLPIPQ